MLILTKQPAVASWPVIACCSFILTNVWVLSEKGRNLHALQRLFVSSCLLYTVADSASDHDIFITKDDDPLPLRPNEHCTISPAEDVPTSNYAELYLY